VVDLAALGESVGIYPGGQAGNPADPSAADQLPLWARGEYAPLWFAARAGELPASGVRLRFLLHPAPPTVDAQVHGPAPD
jgi:acyl-homoserine lactone acylase PvdQ